MLFRQVVLAISFCQEVRTPQTSAMLPCSGFSHWHLPPSKKPQTFSVLWTSGYQERGWHPQTHFMLTTKWPQMSRNPYSQLACATQPGSARLSQKAATLSFQTIQLHFPLPLFARPSVNPSTLLDPRAYLAIFHSPCKPTRTFFFRKPSSALRCSLGHSLYSFKGQPSSCTAREAAD